jgi:hypothetical protein
LSEKGKPRPWPELECASAFLTFQVIKDVLKFRTQDQRPDLSFLIASEASRCIHQLRRDKLTLPQLDR